jgi:hypothetical protein
MTTPHPYQQTLSLLMRAMGASPRRSLRQTPDRRPVGLYAADFNFARPASMTAISSSICAIGLRVS